MSIDSKKSNGRKTKSVSVAGKDNPSRLSCLSNVTNNSKNAVSSHVNGENFKKLEQLMDAPDEEIDQTMFPYGTNPFLVRERCLLCNCERRDPPGSENIKTTAFDTDINDNDPLAQFPLWVCPPCRKAADQDSYKESPSDMDADSDSFLSDLGLKTVSEPTTPNGSLCTCDACTDRSFYYRAVESVHEMEAAELKQSWSELCKVVRCLYCRRDINTVDHEASDNRVRDLVHRVKQNGHIPNAKIYTMTNTKSLLQQVRFQQLKFLGHIFYLPDEELAKTYALYVPVHGRLCSRDPHQLFLRLESQVREFVIEMEVKLLKQLSTGFKSPPQAKTFIALMLNEYGHLCKVAKKMAGLLQELQNHLQRFKVTWELHNKHLFQSVVFSEPSIKNSLSLLLNQLRLGAALKESYIEDAYPNLLHRYLKFEDEMSVIGVVWRDCHQLIESYNEEQTTLKMKQKMLKDDWEFFKSQRKILEQQVSYNPKASLSHTLEAQFTETMRLMLQGNNPTQEELTCPRCNRKRCPCDECAITHMITCGIINPDAINTKNAPNPLTSHHQMANLFHDPNRYRIDVSPPSMSSTTSSSGSTSPIIIGEERLPLPFNDRSTLNDDADQPDGNSQSSGDEDIDEGDEGDDADNEEEPNEKDDTSLLHPSPLKIKTDENQCQCHVCLQQQGKTISTNLPQHIPAIVPRPGELHLYPHIHGSSGLHSLARGHVRPILQPNLYNLHLPSNQQRKSIIQQTNMDFNLPDGINDYHTFGDWENTIYDPRLLLGPDKFDSELLPPPPFSSPYASSLLTEPLSPPEVYCMRSTSNEAFLTTTPSSKLDATKVTNISSTKELPETQCDTKLGQCAIHNVPMSLPMPNCIRPATLGGNITQMSTDKNPLHCRNQNLQTTVKTNTITGHGAHSPTKMTPEFMKSKEGRQMVQQFANSLKQSSHTNHACKHGNNVALNHQELLKDKQLDVPCSKSLAAPALVNNVSVGTSMACTEPDCDGNHDNDSLDDNSSEKSSSTTTSQKEGKFCDCCYCEFFGHGNPAMAPTSKNYPEMREKLRLRLKKKQSEPRSDDIPCTMKCTGLSSPTVIDKPLPSRASQPSCTVACSLDPVETKGLDELIKFINGTEENSDKKPVSAKAAKRARQKLRKQLEEKAKLDAESHKKEVRKSLEESKYKPCSQTANRSSMSEDINGTDCSSKQSDKKVQTYKAKHKDESRTLQVSITYEMENDTLRAATSHFNSSTMLGQNDLGNVKSAAAPEKHISNTPSTVSSHVSMSKDGFTSHISYKDMMTEQHSHIRNQEMLKKLQQDTTNELINSHLDDIMNKEKLKKSDSGHIHTNNNKQIDCVQQNGDNKQLLLENNIKMAVKTSKSLVSKSAPLNTSSMSQDITTIVNEKNEANKQQINKNIGRDSPRAAKKLSDNVSRISQQETESVSGSSSLTVKPPLTDQVDTSLVNQSSAITPKQELLQKCLTNTSEKSLEMSKQESQYSDKKAVSGKNKKTKRKGKGSGDISFIDEVFMPKSGSDIDGGELDEFEKEIEEFKRFCADSSTPIKREKLQVNVNIKDIFSKKKNGLACS